MPHNKVIKIKKRITKIINLSRQMKKQTRLESIIKEKKVKENIKLEETNLTTKVFKEVQKEEMEINKKEIRQKM